MTSPTKTRSQLSSSQRGRLCRADRSGDTAHPGIAPGADIAALQVFNESGKSSYNYVADALQWVIDNHSQHNITAVNISLSDGNNYTNNWFSQDGGIGQKVASLIEKLDALNIPVITADGNSYSGAQGVGFPAILPNTINVTATDASNHIVANAQRLGSTLGGLRDDRGRSEGDLALVRQPVRDVDGTTCRSDRDRPWSCCSRPTTTGLGAPTVAELKSWIKQATPVSDPPPASRSDCSTSLRPPR